MRNTENNNECVDEYNERDEDEISLSAALSEQWNGAPWYVSSLVIHSVLLLFLMLIPVEERSQEQQKPIVIYTDTVEKELEKLEPILDPIEQDFKSETEVVIDAPVTVSPEFEVAEKFETENDEDFDEALGDPTDVAMSTEEEPGPPSLMGVGHSNPPGGGGRFGKGRGGSKNTYARKGGGGPHTIKAAGGALRWLAVHQDEDGHWDNAKYGGGGHNAGDVGVTSLALLAFLGNGNSTKFGPYRDNVKRATAWLIKQQQPNGCIGPHRYNAGIALMAMAESYGMSADPQLKAPAQKAVDWAAKSQCPSGGWDYSASSTRVDTSVTGWWVMGLKSAKVSGLIVPSETFEKAREYIQQATSEPKGGESGYGLCTISYSSQAPNLAAVKRGGGSARLTAVSNTCLQFLGRPREGEQVQGTAHEILQKGVPDGAKFDFYRWYYSALGLFQMGVRSEFWTKWNKPMVNALLSTQVKEGVFKENKGSWNFESDPYGSAWGRVGQTALGALMLEVYYRYENTHEKKGL